MYWGFLLALVSITCILKPVLPGRVSLPGVGDPVVRDRQGLQECPVIVWVS